MSAFGTPPRYSERKPCSEVLRSIRSMTCSAGDRAVFHPMWNPRCSSGRLVCSQAAHVASSIDALTRCSRRSELVCEARNAPIASSLAPVS
jgi:hypothetical protein